MAISALFSCMYAKKAVSLPPKRKKTLMKRKVMTIVNVVLGVLATIFAGCHIHKKVAPEPEPVCIYAGPGQMGELNVRQDSAMQSEEVVEPEEMKEPIKPTPVKYGPRPE